MTYREMLELAAKAAGYTITGWTRQGGTEVAVLSDGTYWQPLLKNAITDCMGDALRLAAVLKLHILHNDPDESVLWVSAVLNKRGLHGVAEFKNEWQRVESIRRAIVRAAAEIGKAMNGDK